MSDPEEFRRRRDREADDGNAAGAIGQKRISLALVFAAKVENQARKEDPEDIKNDLCGID
jgi:hypothetical protein